MTNIKIKAMDAAAKAVKYPPSMKQWQAISLTGADILVSAAAGSGKTEVLSERIARKIVNDDWNINEVLVLTFTKAASKEMLERIEKKMVGKLLDINTDESHMKLKMQRLLMNDAQVTTIDSFCANVLKKFYYLVEEKIDGKIRYLSPNFKVLEDNTKYLNKAIDQVLEDLYLSDKKSLDLLFEVFSTKEDIMTVITALYKKMLTIPNYQKYIKEELFSNIFAEDYSDILEEMQQLSSNNYKDVVENIRTRLEKIVRSRKKSVANYKISDSRKNFLESVDSSIEFDETLNNKIVLKNLITDILNENYAYTIEDLLVLFKRDAETTSKSRKKVIPKSELEKLLEQNLEFSKILMLKEYFEFKTNIYNFRKILEKILLEVDTKFLLEKRSENYLDFSDLSHLAIKALEKVVDGQRKDTEASLYYKNLFKEIYVDEYQDNNDLQEYILSLVKSETTHYFRVGDVKQSIYGFRGSNPDLFEEKYQSYSNITDFISDEEYDINKEYEFEDIFGKQGICIVLKENYRSYENVLKTSNFVFNRLMGYGGAGVSYDKNSALYYPESKRKKQEDEEFIPSKIISVESLESKSKAAEELAEKISQEIVRLEKTGVGYSSCALLLRTSKEMKIYSDILAKHGIPSYYREREGLVKSYAFNIVYNLLNFLDNQTREASLLVVLRMILKISYDDIYELTAEEGRHLYEKLQKTTLKKFVEVKEKIEKWIRFSYDNNAYDIVMEVAHTENLHEYLASLDVEDSEIDYYENVLEIVRKASKEDFNISYSVSEMKTIASGKIFESARRTPENSVIISTIHNSKGLEYGYVFLTGLDGDFKFDDKDKLLFTPELALAIDESMFYKNGYSFGVNKEYIFNSNLIRKKSVEEEIRNLYVALTRAKNALYICTSGKLDLVETDEPNSEKSLADLLQMAFRKYESLDETDITESGTKIEDFVLVDNREEAIEEESNKKAANTDKDWDKKIKSIDSKVTEEFIADQWKFIGPKYVEKDAYPIKTSYSQMKRYNEGVAIKNNPDENERDLELEKYANSKTNKGKEEAILLGNTIHKIFERIVNDIRSGIVIDSIETYLYSLKRVSDIFQNVREKRILSEEEYRVINDEKNIKLIESFISEELVDLVKNSSSVRTEIAFTSMKKTSEIYDNVGEEAADDKIILQGVIDLLIKLDNETYVIIDYKTDRVLKKNGEQVLIERHKPQLDIYADSVIKYYGNVQVKKYIYSYVLAKLIEVH
ncbi:MAG: UvrD-helicase domain-containing protein [Gemella sp.]|nr:UvrD-helicase domain-containing protein [Gemella sp.]